MNFENIKKDSVVLASLGGDRRNEALKRISLIIQEKRENIKKANETDLNENRNIPVALYNRLKLSDSKIDEMISGISGLIELDDPLNKTLLATELDDGLELYKVSVPIGVIGVIFEARPDALVQIVSLCIKSGNCVILKGGSEAANSNRYLTELIKEATAGLVPEHCITLLETRENVKEMLSFDQYIDLIIPRGSNDLVKYIQSNTKIPVLGHADGVCHAYVDQVFDESLIKKIIIDSKTQYPSACNSIETILVKRSEAAFIGELMESLKAAGVRVNGCSEIAKKFCIPEVSEWHHEYGDLEVSLKIVDSIDEGIDHINKYGSGHTEVILTDNNESKIKFTSLVDTSSVMVNCSTRFADGFRYGFGAEVGISTNKIHARGPVGLDGLVIYKYIILGRGQIVAEYSGEKSDRFKHARIDKKFSI